MDAEVCPELLPLCVNCDGTLLHTDLPHESLCLLAKQSLFSLLLLPRWSMRGKSHLKQQIAACVQFNFDSLPICESVVEPIQQARAGGRKVVLTTASPRPWAEGVSRRVGLFDDVIASDEHPNHAGRAKAHELGKRYAVKVVRLL